MKMMPMPELNRRAFEILCKELGAIDAARFFGQLGLGTGNYTLERRELFADLTLDEYRAHVRPAPPDAPSERGT